jgi:hypothetical protein
MNKVASSPDRYTFHQKTYLDKMVKERDPDKIEDLQAMVEVYEDYKSQAAKRLVDPEWQKNNMEYDLRSTEWVCQKAKDYEWYAQNLYAAICNNEFQKLDVVPILKNQTWSASWRYAGGIIADMLEKGDYIDWYCSGIRNDYDPELAGSYPNNYVPEGRITDEIRTDLQRLGWVPAPGGDWENFNTTGEKVK